MTFSFTTKENKRAVGQELPIADEPHVVSLVFPYVVKLIEVPLQGSVVVPGFSLTTSTSPGVGQVSVNYQTGYLIFNASAAGDSVLVSYYGRGSIVDALDVNDLQTLLTEVANEVVDAAGSQPTLNDRLDVILNPDGTLVDDVTAVNLSVISSFTLPVLFSEPGSPSVGDMWYDSGIDAFVGRKASGTVILG